ncbi:unnamed protein product, partial [Tetraodon nigroviridis]
ERPLQSLKLASHAVLEEAQQRGRLKCSKCGGSRKFFCYTCCLLVGVTQEDVPLIKVVMVFPGPRAVSVQDMMQHLHDQSNSGMHHTCDEPKRKRLKCDELGNSRCTAESEAETKDTEPRQRPLQRVVFIDSTWNQTNKISTDERLQDLLQVELKMRKLVFGVIRRENRTPTWLPLRRFIIFYGITTSIVLVRSMMESMIISSFFTPSCTLLSTKLRLRGKREISWKNRVF